MTKLFLLLTLLLAATTHAAVMGNPFIPEEDARFDAIEGNAAVNSSQGLHQKQIAVATYDFAVQGGASTAYTLPVVLPANAFITRSYLWVTSSLVSASSNATLAFSCQTANNILSASTLNLVGPTSAFEGVSTGASTLFKNITSACNITATVAVAPLTAGKVTAFVEYSIHP